MQTQQLEPPLLQKQETHFYSVLNDLKRLNVKDPTPQASPTPTDGTNGEKHKNHPPSMLDVIQKLKEIKKKRQFFLIDWSIIFVLFHHA